MVIYAGTTRDHGKRRDWYVDAKDALPPRITCYREYLYCPSQLPFSRILALIRQCEAEGQRISWRVGEQVYESPEWETRR